MSDHNRKKIGENSCASHAILRRTFLVLFAPHMPNTKDLSNKLEMIKCELKTIQQKKKNKNKKYTHFTTTSVATTKAKAVAET